MENIDRDQKFDRRKYIKSTHLLSTLRYYEIVLRSI